MIITYKSKKKEKDIINSIKPSKLNHIHGIGESILIKGNNINVLKKLLEDNKFKGKVDLIYIDPPFATNSSFGIGEERISTVSKGLDDRLAYKDTLIGEDFLEFIRERLVLLRELLSDKGSIYLHIDYKIGHYIKILMDEIFGIQNFRNDITRIKCNPKNFQRKAYGNIKDLILFYSKSKNHIWKDHEEKLSQNEIDTLFKKRDKNGRAYTTIPLHAPGETLNGATGMAWNGILPPKGRHWRSSPAILQQWEDAGLIEWSKNGVPRKIIYAEQKKGKKRQDIWEFKDPQYPHYPTEKNIQLLESIISTSSENDSIVLDCFCGSGTTLLAAQKLGRKRIGIDQSDEAINVIKKRLGDLPYQYFEEEENH